MTVRLTGLNIHPVKSTAIRPVGSAEVLTGGLVDDRSWAVVDADGELVTAREAHELFTVVADTPATDASVPSALRLSAPGRPSLSVDHPSGPLVRVQVFSQSLQGIEAGAEADDWLRTAVGRADLRLVWCDDPTRRTLNPAFSSPGDHTAYADGYPVTLASESSLRQLNDWIAETALERGEDVADPLPMQRFRPNLVVDGDEAFAEDDWSKVEIAGVTFRVAKATGRCVMTTIDLESLQTGKEPIRTLARHRRPVTDTLFAIHLIPERTGTISVGDEVSVG